MAKWIRYRRAQGNVALVLVIAAITALFVVNFYIRKMIDDVNIPVSQEKPKNIEPVIAKQDADIEVVPPNSNGGTVEQSQKEIVTSQKRQATPFEAQKEIIHEPSIKENILLQ